MGLNKIKKTVSAALSSALVVLLLMSCSTNADGNDSAEKQVNPASELFNKKCSLCHGMAGDKQLSGAKKLTESLLTPAEIETIVTNGLRQMPPFSNQLSAEEIKSVSEYAFSFRTKQK